MTENVRQREKYPHLPVVYQIQLKTKDVNTDAGGILT